MLAFFGGLWRIITAAKNFTVNLIFLLFVALILAAIFAGDKIQMADSTALVIDPSGALVEQKRMVDPVSRFLSNYDQEPETLFRDIMVAIDDGAEDPRVKALVLRLDGMAGAPMSMLEELGARLGAFKQTGKPVYAFGPSYTQSQYYLAAHADHVYLDKHSFTSFGGVFMTGLGIYPTYFKSALDKMKVKLHVFRTGEYKSAVEPYIRDNMSDEAREANLAWIGELWSGYADTIVTNRGIERDQFDHYTNQFDEVLGEADNDPLTLAIDSGLVDELVSRDEFDRRLGVLVGETSSKANQIGFRDYLTLTRPPIPVVDPIAEKIAVITAKGTILDGEQPPGDIGGDTISRLIEQARNDDTVKAIVLRVDSPGGSASASERIRSELELTQTNGKPVVVSMSGYAASGGYWISATANKIFAQESTVTGSIGTFIVFPTFAEALGEFGVYSDGVGTTNLSGALDPFRTMNPVLERTLQRSVYNTYSKFIKLVARGRNMTPDDVDSIAQGRVWTGRKALELGLIDGIGSLEDAIESAALLADVADFDVLYLEQELSPRQRLINQALNSSLESVHAAGGGVWTGFSTIERLSQDMKTLVTMSKAPGVYLQCVYCKVLP